MCPNVLEAVVRFSLTGQFYFNKNCCNGYCTICEQALYYTLLNDLTKCKSFYVVRKIFG